MSASRSESETRVKEPDWSRQSFVAALQVDARHLDIILNNGSTGTATKLVRAREWVGSHRAALAAAALSPFPPTSKEDRDG